MASPAKPSPSGSPYLVRGLRRNGSVTYRCHDAEWALRKWRDFQHVGYSEITVTAPDGRSLSEDDLTSRLERRAALEPATD